MHCIKIIFIAAAFSCAALSLGHTAAPPYNSNEVDVKPVLKRPIRVHFPRWVRRKGEAIEITLRLLVKIDGKVSDITVVKFSDPRMVDPAVDAYGEAEYTPGSKDGRPVETWIEATETAPAL